MKKYSTHRYTPLIVRKFPIKILKKYRNALILTQDTSNQSCRVRLTHVRTERYILIVSTLRVNPVTASVKDRPCPRKQRSLILAVKWLKNGLDAICSGTPTSQVSKTFGVPRTTLNKNQRFCHGTSGYVGPFSLLGFYSKENSTIWLSEMGRMAFSINTECFLYFANFLRMGLTSILASEKLGNSTQDLHHSIYSWFWCKNKDQF